MKKLVVVGATAMVLLASGCGTIKSKDYTDMAVRAAIAETQNASLQQANDAQKSLRAERSEAQRLWIEQQQFLDGRRSHRPGGA